MSQSKTIVTQPDSNLVLIDPTPLFRDPYSPVAVILAIAILLWVLRPVMLQNNQSSKK